MHWQGGDCYTHFNGRREGPLIAGPDRLRPPPRDGPGPQRPRAPLRDRPVQRDGRRHDRRGGGDSGPDRSRPRPGRQRSPGVLHCVR